MKTSFPRLVAVALATLAANILPLSAQTVIYREVFGREAGTGNTSFSTYAWQVFGPGVDSEGANTPAFDYSASFGNAGISPEATAGTGSFSNINSLPSVNSDPTGTQPLDNGRTFLFLENFLTFTEEYVVDRSLFTVTDMTWDQRGTGPALSAAVRIEGQWYVSQTVPNTNAAGVWDTASFDFATATWTTLDFTAGFTLALGSATVLPEGNLSAFGLYAPSGGGGGSRFDGFTINAVAVPEPSTLAFLGAAALGVAFFRFRRRSAASVD